MGPDVFSIEKTMIWISGAFPSAAVVAIVTAFVATIAAAAALLLRSAGSLLGVLEVTITLSVVRVVWMVS